jgi:hypothetical protein
VEPQSAGTSYEVHSGRETLAVQQANSPYEALVDYLRALGCRDDELMRMGNDAVAWRGARYRAVPAGDDGFSSQCVA